MKYYFIDDEHGAVLSEDGKRRFSVLTGTNAIGFFETPRGQGSRFMEQRLEDSTDSYFIEVPHDLLNEFRQEERRTQYVRDIIEKSGYMEIPVDGVFGESGEETGEEMAADDAPLIENMVLQQLEIERLHIALGHLSEEELRIVTMLYLEKEPMTERELASCLGIPNMTLHNRKNVILKKLKKFLK